MSEKQKAMQEKRRGAFYRIGTEERREDSGGETDEYAQRIIGKP